MSVAFKVWLTLLALLIPAGVMWVIGDEVDVPLLRIIGAMLITAFLAMTFFGIIAAIWA